jgi:hypothetical protein
MYKKLRRRRSQLQAQNSHRLNVQREKRLARTPEGLLQVLNVPRKADELALVVDFQVTDGMRHEASFIVQNV